MTRAGMLVQSVLVLASSTNCALLAPDSVDVQESDLRVTATLAAGSGTQAPCRTSRELAEDYPNLSGRAQLLGASDAVTIGQGELEVLGIDDENALELAGEFTFDIFALQPQYRFNVALLYQGHEVEGVYAGLVVLESGFEITVSSLTVPRLLGQPDGTFTATDVEFCVASDAVDQGQAFCTSQAEIDNGALVYDPAANRVTYSYRRANVDWLGKGTRTIVVSLDGELEPLGIYDGTETVESELGRLPPEVAVTLQPIANSGPGAVGERLAGTVSIRFEDGDPPTETGTFALTRTEVLACDPGS